MNQIKESQFVASLHVNQRKTYWKLKEQIQTEAHSQGTTDAAQVCRNYNDDLKAALDAAHYL